MRCWWLLVTEGVDNISDERVLCKALAVRINAGTHDNEVVAGNNCHILTFFACRRERAFRHAGV